MMPWLRRFFYSDDPEVRVAAALSEPEAKMWRELLSNNDIPAAAKNVTGGFWAEFGCPSPVGNDYDLFVKESDAERAREVLAPLLVGPDGDTTKDLPGNDGARF